MLIEPLPTTGISKLLGLCELLDDHGGEEDVFALSRDLHMAFSEILLVIKAGEMLELVETSRNQVKLTLKGSEALKATLQAKKELLRGQMLKLQVFQHIVKLLEAKPGNEVPAEVIVEELAVLLPQEQPRQLFTTLLNWGRYGEIFGYARETDSFQLLKR
jgi:NitT/TauT family transport system ATP-binding protein